MKEQNPVYGSKKKSMNKPHPASKTVDNGS